MRRGKAKVAFIISMTATGMFALLAAAGAIIYFAKAFATFVLPFSLFAAGLAGVIVSACVAFAVIPKNGEEPLKSEDKKSEDKKNDEQ